MECTKFQSLKAHLKQKSEVHTNGQLSCDDVLSDLWYKEHISSLCQLCVRMNKKGCTSSSINSKCDDWMFELFLSSVYLIVVFIVDPWYLTYLNELIPHDGKKTKLVSTWRRTQDAVTVQHTRNEPWVISGTSLPLTRYMAAKFPFSDH